jgi:uncharacterized protein
MAPVSTRITRALAAVVLGCAIAAWGAERSAFVPDTYRAEIEAWRAQRLEELKAPDGYLNLVGLYWLEPGTRRIGSAADNDIVFPAAAAAHIGTLRVGADGVVLEAEPGADVRRDGQPVHIVAMADDWSEHPVTVTQGSLAWSIIRRDRRFALRLRDLDSPVLTSFPPIEYFPIDPKLRVNAVLHRYDEPRVIDVDTVIEGLGYHPQSPGTLAFEIGGKTYELEAYNAGDSLFVVFADATSGHETYPAGRFLYAGLPDASGRTVLDFNRAHNPPCAYNDFATCPVASPRNRLSVAIEAGEKFDVTQHARAAGGH